MWLRSVELAESFRAKGLQPERERNGTFDDVEAKKELKSAVRTNAV